MHIFIFRIFCITKCLEKYFWNKCKYSRNEEHYGFVLYISQPCVCIWFKRNWHSRNVLKIWFKINYCLWPWIWSSNCLMLNVNVMCIKFHCISKKKPHNTLHGFSFTRSSVCMAVQNCSNNRIHTYVCVCVLNSSRYK